MKLISCKSVSDQHVVVVTDSIVFVTNIDVVTNNLVTNTRFCCSAGTIPPTIGNMSSLKVFDLGPNYITGSIPRELGRLSNLNFFTFYGNSLTHAIPQELFNMSSLQTFSLQHNSLSGTFPPYNKIFLPNLENLYYSSNQITGNLYILWTNFSNFTNLAAIIFYQF
ncbi:putative non-specific serine/threonine protein kinase [Rosa chinensis]|uniref:Putative non-specific serine/threonine protein kinase n=1 Tax=Rosa chinensis TaxID=74649 RepID=A0A2P6QTU6_ROSCH|nr:putative non-specific serine/threonine protein kinase [Rosa chinensis]